jgi:hypothetical protein
MKTNRILMTAAVTMAVTAVVGAQAADTMGDRSKRDAMSTTYTGCVESVNHGGAFLLTRIDASEPMHGDMAMKHDDDMAMKRDAAKAMQHEQMPANGEEMEATASTALALVGSAGLGKHVGQKVSVTGSLSEGWMGTTGRNVSTLTVKKLKVIAKSCS